MNPESVDARLAAFAAEKYGLFTRVDAHRLGFTDEMIRKRVRSGRWMRIQRGVFAISGFPLSWRRSVLGAVLSCGEGSAASHLTAGFLWSSPGCVEATIEVSVPNRRLIRDTDIRVHRPRELASPDVTSRFWIPVTTPPRTLIDLASMLDMDALEEILDDFIRRKEMTLGWLRWRLDELSHFGKKGIGVIEALCAGREDEGPELDSKLERLLERVIKRSELPRPVRQFEVEVKGKRYYIDFAYPDLMLGIEADGYASRASRQRWEAELVRQNGLQRTGWELLRYTYAAVTQRPDVIVREIAEAIEARSLEKHGRSLLG